jgi:predicted dehydrogenase
MSSSQQTSRRALLNRAVAGALTAPYFVRNLISAPPAGTLRLASFGASGMAWGTLSNIATHPRVKLACVAEADETRLDRVKQKYPDAKIYKDWRQMLAQERGRLDIACVGTPDHMHAPMAMTAMRQGLSVYIQKPLAHDIYEVRRLTETARKRKLIAQMGIQNHSSAEYRTAVQLIQSGTIGKVKEVHAWSEKKWGDPKPLPDRADPVPPGLDWDQWIGVAASRPYVKDIYHPVNWRKRIDFGTATFGDMGCHIYDPIFTALALKSPLSVRSEGPAPGQHNWAIDAVIRYVFPATPYTEGATINVSWYDGDERPPKGILALLEGQEVPGQGSIFIGTKGVMLLPHKEMPVLVGPRFKDFAMPKVEGASHYHLFVDAVLGKAQAPAALDYSGPLTEAVLLGPLATRFPKTTLEWNGAKLSFRNSREADAFVRRRYRKGWEVKGLS